MVCANCGTEIADKAIVCFRCGHATAAAVRKPAPPPTRWRSLVTFLGFIVLVLGALFLGRAGTVDVPDWIRYGVIAVSVALLAWRTMARRR